MIERLFENEKFLSILASQLLAHFIGLGHLRNLG